MSALVVSSIALPFAATPATAQQSGTPGAEANGTDIVVRQNGQCYPISAFGNGSRSIEDFYGYRNPSMEPSGWYRAYGELQGLLREDTSQVLLYNGSEGLSLVFVHDGVSNTSGSGGTVVMNVSGLPAEGNWSVQDDDYRGQDDVFEVGGSRAHVEWVWNEGNRSDGAAFVGLGRENREEITVDPAFNEQSPRYPFEKWEGSPESNEIDSWVARSANGTSYELAMDESITITRGPCDGEAPSAALTASTTALTPGAEVTLNASGSTDNDAISAYRWDLDSDGTIETETNDSTLATTYDSSGAYDPRVTVVDRANNTANASVSLQVEAETTTTTSTTTTATATSEDTATGTDSSDTDRTTETAAPTSGSGSGEDGGDAGGSGVSGGVDAAIERASALADRASGELNGMERGNLIGLAVLGVALVAIGLVVLRR
ncbi:hypothetical protein BRC86_01490 [Halobacteriales archaeon QS_3_64_16]|nr:MAG: hypothetical protein BRC86_01490 [Halobacteriales archaeon QS_3_64_16]